MGIFNKFSKKKTTNENQHEENNDVQDWFFGSFLMNEAKFRHQPLTVKRSSKNDQVTLEYILKELLNIDPNEIGHMTVVQTGEFGKEESSKTIKSKDEILAFKPFETLMYTNNEGEEVPRTGLNTTLILSYRPGNIVFDDIENKSDKSKLCTDNSIIMFLRGIGPFVYETAYMRVSVMIPNFTSPDDFRTSQSKNSPYTTSFVLGYDIVSPEKRLKRYDEIESSLIEKSRNGEELSYEEQTVLEGITYSKDLGHDLGYGKWLVGEKRFADALIPLMKAYDHLKKAVVTDYDKIHRVFNDTCFHIGYCFNELEQFDRAIFYLDLITGCDIIKYTIERINAYVNNKDPRALNAVQYHLKEFYDKQRIVDSEETMYFYDFLHRRLAYLFIEYKMWDKARNLLESLKEIPSCREFALSELEYLKKCEDR